MSRIFMHFRVLSFDYEYQHSIAAVPAEPGHSKCTPEGTRAPAVAAFQGGSDGVILSRKYSEMKLVNLKSARLALQNLGLA
jgi:hypothetical protein